MKHLSLFVLFALVSAATHAESCRIAAAAPVRETPGGRILGSLPANLNVTLFERSPDDHGKNWALVRWRGKPNHYNRYFRVNTGWVAPSAVRCTR